MPERRTLYDGEEAVYPRTISSEVYVSDGVTFEDQIAESLGLVEEAEQMLINGIKKDYKTYTVRIDLNNSDPETACEYMDDAVGMTPGYNGWKDTDLIKNIKPCVLNNGEVQYYLQKDDYTKKEDGTASILDGTDGDVMIEISKIGYKLWNDGNYQYVSIIDDPNKEGYCYYAHSLNNTGDCDKIYIGAYLGHEIGSNLYSASAVDPTADTSLIDFRTYAANKGTGYSLLSFYPLTLLQCLYIIIYKNLDSQSALGAGYIYASSKANTGSTNNNTFCYGNSSPTTHVKFLGIEDFYGNLYQRIDGLYCDSNRNIRTDYRNSVFIDNNGNNFQFSTSSGLTSNIGGYMTQIQGTNETGFVAKSTGGSSSTYYCDYGYLYTGFFGYFGGDWDNGTEAGAFQFVIDSSVFAAASYLGARLMYKHKSN